MSPLLDGRYYDIAHAYLVRDVAMWRALAGAPCRVLELACGTGRVAIPLARDGHAVTGLDTAPAMLAQARHKAQGIAVDFVLADMREFALPAPFDLVIVPFNGLRLLLERDDLERCLGCVRRALAPGGRFAFDLQMPRPDQLAPGDKQFEHRDPDTGAPLVALYRGRYDAIAQRKILDIEFRFADGTVATDHLEQRIYFPQELEALLAYNGFDVVERYGDHDRGPLGPDSSQLVMVCHQRTSTAAS